MARAFIFPGQGSQFIGMGQAIADAFPAAREVFEEVDDALERHLTKIMWEGPIDALNSTANTQPALMAHSIAMVRVMEAQTGLDIANARFVAGHSLGEYSALCATRALPLADTARILQARGEAMQAAVPEGEGAMAALLGADIEKAQNAIDAAPGDGVLEIANDNAPGQVVVSGTKTRVEALAQDVRTHGIKMAKMLPVSAPFHCSLMAPAAAVMKEKLAEADFTAPAAPIVANVLAKEAAGEPDTIRTLLEQQVTGRVRWRESVEYMVENGVDRFVEIGSGKVLCGLVRRINGDASVMSVGEPSDLDAFVEA